MHSLLPSSKAEKVESVAIAVVQTIAVLHRNSLAKSGGDHSAAFFHLKQML
jgi:hypothetical protein